MAKLQFICFQLVVLTVLLIITTAPTFATSGVSRHGTAQGREDERMYEVVTRNNNNEVTKWDILTYLQGSGNKNNKVVGCSDEGGVCTFGVSCCGDYFCAAIGIIAGVCIKT